MKTAALLLLAAAQLLRAAGDWETWEGCRFEADKYFDGDSFHVQHGSESAIVRLYFADAPETDAGLGTRVVEQAAYFKTNNAAVLRAGGAAKELTGAFLAKPFRVITRRQVAPGASRSERIYAVVEQDGRRLDAALIEAGLARAGGAIADCPDAAAGQKTFQMLRAMEAKAASGQRGLWARTTVLESLKERLRPLTKDKGPRRINLNAASAAELESLPGVGPKMAQQFIRARPIKDVAALDAIPGIGPKKIEALRDLISFE